MEITVGKAERAQQTGGGGSDAVMLQIRRLHAHGSSLSGPALTLKLFCRSFFSSLSSQSLHYATHNAIAQTT